LGALAKVPQHELNAAEFNSRKGSFNVLQEQHQEKSTHAGRVLVPIVCPSESALHRYQITVHQAGRQRYVQVIPHMLNIAIKSGVDFRLTGAGQYSRGTI
jgi:hypothetical protein